MKKFIKNVGLFSLSTLLFLIIIFFISKKIIQENTNFYISPKIDKIIIGDSHSECALNDKLINNGLNISNSGTCYFYNYYTLKPLIDNNKNIKYVFIDFTNNQIDSIMEDWIWGDKYLPFKFEKIGNYIDRDGLKLLFKKNKIGLLKSYLQLLKSQLTIILTFQYHFLFNCGKYIKLVRSNVKHLLNNNNIDTAKITNYYIPTINILYLEKMIQICKEKNIKVFLIRNPLHIKYRGFKNELIYQKILQTRFKNIDFLDFKNFRILDSEFGDLEHLNYIGATKFSVFFDKLIKDGLLNKKNKQEFINSNLNSANN